MMTFLLPHGDSKNFPGWPQRSVQVTMSFSFLSLPFPFFTASIKTSSFTLRHNLINPAPRIPISSDLPTVTCLVTQCAIPLWSCSSYRMRIRPGLCDIKANELGGKIIQTHNYWFCLNNWLNCFFFSYSFLNQLFFSLFKSNQHTRELLQNCKDLAQYRIRDKLFCILFMFGIIPF